MARPSFAEKVREAAREHGYFVWEFGEFGVHALQLSKEGIRPTILICKERNESITDDERTWKVRLEEHFFHVEFIRARAGWHTVEKALNPTPDFEWHGPSGRQAK